VSPRRAGEGRKAAPQGANDRVHMKPTREK
jgi:hypothetical protein